MGEDIERYDQLWGQDRPSKFDERLNVNNCTVVNLLAFVRCVLPLCAMNELTRSQGSHDDSQCESMVPVTIEQILINLFPKQMEVKLGQAHLFQFIYKDLKKYSSSVLFLHPARSPMIKLQEPQDSQGFLAVLHVKIGGRLRLHPRH